MTIPEFVDWVEHGEGWWWVNRYGQAERLLAQREATKPTEAPPRLGPPSPGGPVRGGAADPGTFEREVEVA